MTWTEAPEFGESRRPQLPYACIVGAGMRPSRDHDASDSGPDEEHGRLGQRRADECRLFGMNQLWCSATLVAQHESAAGRKHRFGPPVLTSAVEAKAAMRQRAWTDTVANSTAQ